MDSGLRNESIIRNLADGDIEKLANAQKSYGHSWISRGLRGAYFVMVRKIDRIENQMRQATFDLPTALSMFPGKDGIIDDIRDLRQYLLLIEAEIIAQHRLNHAGVGAPETPFHHRAVEPSGDDVWYCSMCAQTFALPHAHSPMAKHSCPALAGEATGLGYVDQAKDTVRPRHVPPRDLPRPPEGPPNRRMPKVSITERNGG